MHGFRFVVTVIIFSSFFLYSILLKKNSDSYFSPNNDYVVEKIPNIFYSYLDKTSYPRSALSFVHFWATWCAPCEKEFPEFVNFINSFEGKVTGILIASNDSVSKVNAKLKKFNVSGSFKVIHDEKGELLKNFGSLRVPETFIFNSSGELVKKFVGPQDWSNKFYLENTKFLINKNKSL